VPLWATLGVSAVVLVLITIGVAAAIGRVVFPADMVQRAESVRAEAGRGRADGSPVH
jgi:hypothetical protein